MLKLCEKIKNDCGVVCKSETFGVIREEFAYYKWAMQVDLDKSLEISKEFLKKISFSTCLCVSTFYMKDLLAKNKLVKVVDWENGEIIIEYSLQGIK